MAERSPAGGRKNRPCLGNRRDEVARRERGSRGDLRGPDRIPPGWYPPGMEKTATHPLHGKAALVTGASSGIGRATALRLARLGARVALAARTESALQEAAGEIERAGGRALVLPTDVTDPEQSRLAVARTVEHFGRLDLLVCSAGVSMRS